MLFTAEALDIRLAVGDHVPLDRGAVAVAVEDAVEGVAAGYRRVFSVDVGIVDGVAAAAVDVDTTTAAGADVRVLEGDIGGAVEIHTVAGGRADAIVAKRLTVVVTGERQRRSQVCRRSDRGWLRSRYRCWNLRRGGDWRKSGC